MGFANRREPADLDREEWRPVVDERSQASPNPKALKAQEYVSSLGRHKSKRAAIRLSRGEAAIRQAIMRSRVDYFTAW